MTKVTAKKGASTAKTTPAVTKSNVSKAAKKPDTTSTAAVGGSFSKTKRVSIEACKSWYDAHMCMHMHVRSYL